MQKEDGSPDFVQGCWFRGFRAYCHLRRNRERLWVLQKWGREDEWGFIRMAPSPRL